MDDQSLDHLPLPTRRMAQLIDDLKRRLGWTQKEIRAALGGTTQATVSRLRTGEFAKLDATFIDALKRSSLQLDPLYFFDDPLVGDGTFVSYLRGSRDWKMLIRTRSEEPGQAPSARDEQVTGERMTAKGKAEAATRRRKVGSR